MTPLVTAGSTRETEPVSARPLAATCTGMPAAIFPACASETAASTRKAERSATRATTSPLRTVAPSSETTQVRTPRRPGARRRQIEPVPGLAPLAPELLALEVEPVQLHLGRARGDPLGLSRRRSSTSARVSFSSESLSCSAETSPSAASLRSRAVMPARFWSSSFLISICPERALRVLSRSSRARASWLSLRAELVIEAVERELRLAQIELEDRIALLDDGPRAAHRRGRRARRAGSR
jgi:hypothetical protein